MNIEAMGIVPQFFYRKSDAETRRIIGLKPTQIDEAIANGTLPPPAKVVEGGRASGWQGFQLIEYIQKRTARAAAASEAKQRNKKRRAREAVVPVERSEAEMTRDILQLRALRKLADELDLLAAHLRDESECVEAFAQRLKEALTPQGENLRFKELQKMRSRLRSLHRQELAHRLMDYEKLVRGDIVEDNNLANEILEEEEDAA